MVFSLCKSICFSSVDWSYTRENLIDRCTVYFEGGRFLIKTRANIDGHWCNSFWVGFQNTQFIHVHNPISEWSIGLPNVLLTALFTVNDVNNIENINLT